MQDTECVLILNQFVCLITIIIATLLHRMCCQSPVALTAVRCAGGLTGYLQPLVENCYLV